MNEPELPPEPPPELPPEAPPELPPEPTPAASAQPDPGAEPPAAAPLAELAPAACAARLAELFPAVFTPGKASPLKLRIQTDIQQRAPGVFTKRSLSAFLHRHTTGNAYLRALAAAPARVDLDGAPAGEVSDEHRLAARAELERRRALHEQRRAAERAAQREAEQAARRAARDAEREAQRARSVDDAARRERLALVRAWEATTLTRANFCTLKGVAESQLDAALAAAAQDRQAAPPQQPDPARRARSDGPRPSRPDRGARSTGPDGRS